MLSRNSGRGSGYSCNTLDTTFLRYPDRRFTPDISINAFVSHIGKFNPPPVKSGSFLTVLIGTYYIQVDYLLIRSVNLIGFRDGGYRIESRKGFF